MLPRHPQTAQGGYVNGFVSLRRLKGWFCSPLRKSRFGSKLRAAKKTFSYLFYTVLPVRKGYASPKGVISFLPCLVGPILGLPSFVPIVFVLFHVHGEDKIDNIINMQEEFNSYVCTIFLKTINLKLYIQIKYWLYHYFLFQDLPNKTTLAYVCTIFLKK